MADHYMTPLISAAIDAAAHYHLAALHRHRDRRAELLVHRGNPDRLRV